MGWSNPLVPWSELERALSGRPPLPGRGPDDVLGYRPPTVPTVTTEPTEPIRLSPPRDRSTEPVVPYAELHCHSAFSFLDGASTPELLVAQALELGLAALALTDHDGFYGAVRFCEAAAGTGLKTVYGAELSLGLPEPQLGVPDPVGEHLLVLVRDQEGYRRLAREISRAQLAGGAKGRPVYDLTDLTRAATGHWLIPTGCRKGRVRRALAGGGPDAARRALIGLVELFGRDAVVVELTTRLAPTDDEDNDALAALADELGLPVVATTGAHYAAPRSARLGSAMAAVRARRSLDEADPYLPAGPGAYLRSGAEMARLFARYPGAVDTAAALGRECAFDLKLVAPNLPPYRVPPRARREQLAPGVDPGRCRRALRPTDTQSAGLRPDRKRAARHRRTQFSRLFPDRPTKSSTSAAGATSSARGEDRPPIPRSVMRCTSPRSMR